MEKSLSLNLPVMEVVGVVEIVVSWEVKNETVGKEW